LQNAAKHAGPDASLSIRLAQSDGRVGFRVEDDGGGFDYPAAQIGHGLVNMAGRGAFSAPIRHLAVSVRPRYEISVVPLR
jgi:nitrate/nitrite-specific signal transduction histidine kinase